MLVRPVIVIETNPSMWFTTMANVGRLKRLCYIPWNYLLRPSPVVNRRAGTPRIEVTVGRNGGLS